MRHRLQHRDVDAAALAGLRPLQQRREAGLRGILAGHGVGDGGADDTRVRGRRQKAQVARGGLRDGVIGGPVPRGARRAEARDRAIDQAGVDRTKLRLPCAQLLGHAGAEVLDEHVRRGHEVVQHGAIRRVPRVERDGPLVAVVGLVMRGIEPALERAERVARAGAFHLDYIRPQIGQVQRGGRPGDIGAKLDNADILQDFHWVTPPRGKVWKMPCRHRRWPRPPCGT
jgi:hypothetical protein